MTDAPHPDRITLICDTLKSHFGGTWAVSSKTKSNFSLIYFCTDGNRRMVVKDIVPHLFSQTLDPECPSLAERLNSGTHRFRELLKSFGVKLTEEFMTTTILNGCGALHIISHEGQNCSDSLKQNPTDEHAKKTIGRILDSISGVLHQSQDHPSVGLDLQLANFTLNGECRYIDVFPPLYYDEALGIYIVHEPQPTDQADIDDQVRRKFLTPGTLRRFRHFVRHIKPHWGQILNTELERVLKPTMWEKVRLHFESLPDREIDDIDGQPTHEHLVRIITNLNVNDLDGYRDIAAAVIPDVAERPGLMNTAFMCLRTPGPGDAPIDHVTELTNILSPFTRERY